MLEINCPVHCTCEGFVVMFGTVCAKCLEELIVENQESESDGQEDF